MQVGRMMLNRLKEWWTTRMMSRKENLKKRQEIRMSKGMRADSREEISIAINKISIQCRGINNHKVITIMLFMISFFNNNLLFHLYIVRHEREVCGGRWKLILEYQKSIFEFNKLHFHNPQKNNLHETIKILFLKFQIKNFDLLSIIRRQSWIGSV